MYGLFSILILITCALLLLVILVQNPKGGGLSSSFGGGSSNQIMGAKKTTDFLEKATWTLAIVLIVLSLASNFAIDRTTTEDNNTMKGEEQISTTPLNLPNDNPFKE